MRPQRQAAFPDLLLGYGVLAAFWALGELVSLYALPKIPGSVIGMVALFAALRLGAVRLEWVEHAAQSVLGVLAMLFVPAGVGLILYLDVLADQGVIVVVASVFSTAAVMAVAGLLLEMRMSKRI